jgi:hypothetical protein
MFKTAYSGSSSEKKLDCSEDEVITEQSHKKACDVNEILARFGGIPPSNAQPQFENVLDVPDFQVMQNKIADAKSNFEILPAKIRNEFENDVSKFIEFAQDEKNHQKLRDLGLLPELVKEEDKKPKKEDVKPKAEKPEEKAQDKE